MLHGDEPCNRKVVNPGDERRNFFVITAAEEHPELTGASGSPTWRVGMTDEQVAL